MRSLADGDLVIIRAFACDRAAHRIAVGDHAIRMRGRDIEESCEQKWNKEMPCVTAYETT